MIPIITPIPAQITLSLAAYRLEEPKDVDLNP
jgi:hypothetical protein